MRGPRPSPAGMAQMRGAAKLNRGAGLGWVACDPWGSCGVVDHPEYAGAPSWVG